ncbi:cytochrome-c oxidase, cbb3-type subunit III [Tropicimonas sp. IMCC34043]|uniref:cytochrome-c oxidase, cbb3-type subunit III n=1 Tax=Tropicimonas sp. IMCC34043 TaxID=2248760 RepID=UPI000E24B8C3|nr:cytochrome-c oxidase, cbb3-type subunit III [Tropicimonas sp. IMCC34043]
MSRQPVKKQPEVETTGHSWDGIEELNNPLPRWWLWTFYACIVYALIYSVLWPAWPLVHGATPGLLGKSTRADVAVEMARFEAANAPIQARLVATDLNEVANDPELLSYAQNAGAAVFRGWCAQCHGSGAQGAQNLGYPSLLDDDWLWGGTLDDIYYTVTHGVRNEQDPDARYSQMPAFGRDELLTGDEINQVVNHVLQISGQEYDADLAEAGATVFADNCAACHGEDGTGDQTQGAPNLTDAIWLYGGDAATIHETVTNARFGIMPPQGGSPKTAVGDAERRAVALYVYGLGGGVQAD